MRTPSGMALNRRAIVLGGLFWLIFSVAAVLVRGVRWEESYEFSQVLLNVIHYPEGHPTLIHCRNSFCLQTYVTAAILWLFPGPFIACGIRNVLYILAGTLPAYLLGALISRKALTGHMAALLAFMMAPAFTDAYPASAWPIMSTNGAIGLGFALSTLCVLAIDRPWAACFMVGLMPAIHVGQFPPVFLVGCLYIVNIWRRGRPGEMRRALYGFCAGLAVTVASVLILIAVAVKSPDTGPYVSGISTDTVWQSYLAYFNFHRLLHLGPDQLVLLWSVTLGSALIIAECRRAETGPFLWLGLYTWAIALPVWGTMIIHYLLGNHMPMLLLGWLPYRLPNHLAPLLLSMVAVLLTTARSASGLGLVLIPAVVCAGLGCDVTSIFLGLCGASVHAVYLYMEEDHAAARFWLLVSAAACFVVSRMMGDYYALVVLGAWLTAITVARLDRFAVFRRRFVVSVSWATGITALLIAVGLLYGQWERRTEAPDELLALSPFETKVTRYLQERNEPDAMLAVPPTQWRFQERLNHPVTGDAATLSWIPYHRSIGPVIAKFWKDLYGIDLTRPPGHTSTLDFSRIQVYMDVWARRSPEEWRRIAHEYGFRYVIMRDTVPLQLPVVVDCPPFQMYAIPTEDRGRPHTNPEREEMIVAPSRAER